jgi:hypothetical protein
MPFAYYSNLSKNNRLVYRKSDSIEFMPVDNAEVLHIEVRALEQALKDENRKGVQSFSRLLVNSLAGNFEIPLLNIRVLACRPANDVEELHGLYEPSEGWKKARITVWMKTASRKKVVAFRSFLRTLLHELCHTYCIITRKPGNEYN